jgi:quinoprotein glucose dehydrogenase
MLINRKPSLSVQASLLARKISMPFKPAARPHLVARVFAGLLALLGLASVIGGGQLIAVGGSPFYLLSGLAIIASGVLVWRGSRRGGQVYASVLLVTLAWGIYESGFDGWALLPRLWLWFVVGIGFLIPGVRKSPAGTAATPFGRVAGVFGAGLVVAVFIGTAAYKLGPPEPADPVYEAGRQSGIAASNAAYVPGGEDAGEWHNYGNDASGSRYSPLAQLDTANVAGLHKAWELKLGKSVDGILGSLEVTPLKVGNSLFLCTSYNDVLSVDAETGHVNWRFKSNLKLKPTPHGNCRGVAYYKVPAASGLCAERIISNTVDARLIALDAATGAPCPQFGKNGTTNLLEGMGKVIAGYYFVSSAPTIVRGKIVLGGWISDNQYWGEPSGVIRAFDAVTGKFAWAFDMGRPDSNGPAPAEGFTHSTPNSWAPMSADEELGMVYAPTGNATPDYFGAQRRPFDDKYSSSVLALDAETGKVRWSFQTTHHDLWDYDVASQPTLIDLPGPHGIQRALIQPTKRGEIFLLDRTNGHPLAQVQERKVPQDGIVPEERLSPTQPFSVGMPSFRGPNLRERDMWGVTPFDQMWCRIRFKQARYEGPLTPPGLTPNIAYPGYLGGVDWGSVSVDRGRHLMIVTSSRVPNYDKLVTRAVADKAGVKPVGEGASTSDVSGTSAQANTAYAADITAFLSPLGAPCNEPPYGMITAVDLITHKVVWSKPLGTARDSGPLGIPSMLPLRMGAPIAGGSLTTRGGLVFVAASQERTLRAFNAGTGKELWSSRLPAGGQASPMSYWSNRSKRQFVVIAAGGNVALQSKTGDSIVAYALSNDSKARR